MLMDQLARARTLGEIVTQVDRALGVREAAETMSEGVVCRPPVETRETGSESPLEKGGDRGVLPGQRGTSSADPPNPPFARGGGQKSFSSGPSLGESLA